MWVGLLLEVGRAWSEGQAGGGQGGGSHTPDTRGYTDATKLLLMLKQRWRRDKQSVTVVSKCKAMSLPDTPPDCPAECPWLNFPVNEMPSGSFTWIQSYKPPHLLPEPAAKVLNELTTSFVLFFAGLGFWSSRRHTKTFVLHILIYRSSAPPG